MTQNWFNLNKRAQTYSKLVKTALNAYRLDSLGPHLSNCENWKFSMISWLNIRVKTSRTLSCIISTIFMLCYLIVGIIYPEIKFVTDARILSV